ncbi:hypothetical protein IPL85_05915 [Candidatus Saccharibacteria bacterium]|nr:MAG: hypothetical protein IPL85_05915 [Candidatus Saccharibacteria bacterium]
MFIRKSIAESPGRRLATPRNAAVLASSLLLSGALASCSSSSESPQMTAISEYKHPFFTANGNKLYLNISATGARVLSIITSNHEVEGSATLTTEHKIGPFTVNNQWTEDISGTQQVVMISEKGNVNPSFASLFCDKDHNIVADKTTFVYQGEIIAIPDMIIGDNCSRQLLSVNSIDVATNSYPVTS